MRLLAQSLLAQVVGDAYAVIPLPIGLHLAGNLYRLGPVMGAFVNGQARQACFVLVRGVVQPGKRLFCTIEQAGFEEVQRQGMLRTLALFLADVCAREQMFVHAYGAAVFATSAKKIAQRKMQLGGVRVVLYGFNKGINGLVLLLVEQEIQPFEVGLGGAAVFAADLAQVKARGEPAQHKCRGKAQQNPGDIKFHAAAKVWVRLGWREKRRRLAWWMVRVSLRAALLCDASTSAAPSRRCPQSHRR